MKKWAGITVLFLALAGLIGALSQLSREGGGAQEGAAPMASPAGGEAVDARRLAPQEAGGGAVGTTTSGGAVAAVPAPSPVAGGHVEGFLGGSGVTVDLIGPKVVKTARLSVVVRRGHFGDAFDEATQVARRYAGFVESSATSGTRSRSGRLTIRVPTSAFELAIRDLRALGRVDGQSIQGQDVTAEYVDLQARLRNWESQETVLLRLMRQANTVEETLRVQRELQDVQLNIEQLRGQLRVLNNQTSMSTIDVAMRESGVPANGGAHRDNGTSLGEAWDDATDGFLSVIAAIVIGLGYLIPITVIAVAAWFVYRRVRPPLPVREGIASRLRETGPPQA
jgi:hypothetical protein